MPVSWRRLPPRACSAGCCSVSRGFRLLRGTARVRDRRDLATDRPMDRRPTDLCPRRRDNTSAPADCLSCRAGSRRGWGRGHLLADASGRLGCLDDLEPACAVFSSVPASNGGKLSRRSSPTRIIPCSCRAALPAYGRTWARIARGRLGCWALSSRLPRSECSCRAYAGCGVEARGCWRDWCCWGWFPSSNGAPCSMPTCR